MRQYRHVVPISILAARDNQGIRFREGQVDPALGRELQIAAGSMVSASCQASELKLNAASPAKGQSAGPT